MASFPLLSSRAVTQYPASFLKAQSVEVIRFIDGTDQRFLSQGKQFRSWQVRLDLLNDNEMQQIESFFEAQQGDYSSFVFPDPFSGASVPHCRLAYPVLTTEYLDIDTGATSLWVIETNG